MGKNSKWIVGGCAGCAVGFVVALVIGAACYFGWQHYKQNTDGDSSLEWLTTGDTDDEELSNLSERERILVGRWDYRKMQYEKKEVRGLCDHRGCCFSCGCAVHGRHRLLQLQV